MHEAFIYYIIINESFPPCVELTLSALHKELKTLTKPISFGVSLGIPQEQLEIIQQDNRFGTIAYSIFMPCDIVHYNACLICIIKTIYCRH